MAKDIKFDIDARDGLKKGVDVWNRWHREFYDVFLDLRKADLRCLDLRNANFSRVDLGWWTDKRSL